MYHNNKTTLITKPKYNININKIHIDKNDNDSNYDDNDDVNKWMTYCFMLVFLVSKSIGYS